jgi:Fe2+ transport system protein FeoA
MRLSELKKFEVAEVVEIAGCPKKVALRLAALGVRPQQKIQCLHASPVGGVTSYLLNLGVFAIEDRLAAQIVVEKVRES